MFLCLVVLLFWFGFQVIQCLLRLWQQITHYIRPFKLYSYNPIQGNTIYYNYWSTFNACRLVQNLIRLIGFVVSNFFIKFSFPIFFTHSISMRIWKKAFSHNRYHEKQNQRKWSLSTGSMHPPNNWSICPATLFGQPIFANEMNFPP